MHSVLSPRGQRYLGVALHASVLVLLGLHLHVRTLPATATPLPTPADAESAWWGFWPVTYLPAPALVSGVGSGLVLLVWGQWRLWRQGTTRAVSAGAGRRAARLILPLVGGLLVLAFYALPIVHTRWGDAFVLTHGLSWPDPDLRITHSWQAPLDVYLHSQVWRWLHEPFAWQNAAPSYRLLSPLAGALYLGCALGLSRAHTIGPGWLTFGVLASPALLQLFFGYVENYSFAAAGILLYLWLGLGVVEGRRPLWQAATALALTNGFHPSTLVYWPSLVYLAWWLWRKRERPPGTETATGSGIVLSLVVPAGLVGLGILLLMEQGGHGIAALLGPDRPGGGDGRWLVPLFAPETRWERYTMFSWAHLRDYLNQQVLVAPIVLPALVLLAVAAAAERRKRQPFPRAPIRDRWAGYFLALAAVCHLLLAWVWNPDYGGQRDWDLFSLAAIPSSLLLAWLLPRCIGAGRLGPVMAAPLVFQMLHTAAWIYQNRLAWEWPG